MGDLSLHFSRWEFACKGANCNCGRDTIDAELITVLEEVRAEFGPVTITSGNRCPAVNTASGGASSSQHLVARAADFSCGGTSAETVQTFLKIRHVGKYGIGSANTYTHLDTRTNGPARWDYS